MPLTEIAAWSQLTGIVLEPWQLRAIRLLDASHVHALHAEAGSLTLDDLLNND